MTQQQQRYPIGTQTFSILREGGYVYVDKTDMVYEMTHGNSRYVFLSRPRRFGKSLLVSTLKAYFEGRKELFEGLAIEKLETEWTKYPVLHFSMSTAKHVDKEGLELELNRKLCQYENVYGKKAEDITPNQRLQGLVEHAYEQTGQKVVVLIDEYDAPLLDVMQEEENLPLLYQSGYLTIKDYSREDDEYLLDIPNEEVRIGLMRSLLPEYVTPVKEQEGRQLARSLSRAMREGRIEDALTLLQTFLSGVPYGNEKYSEAHFQSMLYVIFNLVTSFVVLTEVRTATGRMDMAVRTRTHIYLFELKFDGSAEEALRQIDVKNYTAPFSLEGLPIVKIGVNFSSKTRTLDGWAIERP